MCNRAAQRLPSGVHVLAHLRPCVHIQVSQSQSRGGICGQRVTNGCLVHDQSGWDELRCIHLTSKRGFVAGAECPGAFLQQLWDSADKQHALKFHPYASFGGDHTLIASQYPQSFLAYAWQQTSSACNIPQK